MDFRSTRKGNSIYDEIKGRIHRQNTLDMHLAYEIKAGDELTETLGILESKYIFNLFKLDEISFLENKTEEVKKKFCSQKLYIENSDISEKDKIDAILTTACLFTRIYDRIKHLNEASLYLLGLSMVKVRLEEYSVYGKTLTDLLCNNKSELSEPVYQEAMNLILPVIKKQQESEKNNAKVNKIGL